MNSVRALTIAIRRLEKDLPALARRADKGSIQAGHDHIDTEAAIETLTALRQLVIDQGTGRDA